MSLHMVTVNSEAKRHEVIKTVKNQYNSGRMTRKAKSNNKIIIIKKKLFRSNQFYEFSFFIHFQTFARQLFLMSKQRDISFSPLLLLLLILNTAYVMPCTKLTPYREYNERKNGAQMIRVYV